jgi:GT2 family glycosyltransferase
MSQSTFRPKVTVVIPNWNNLSWLPGCLDGLRAQQYQDFQIILVDNGSTDGSVAFVRKNYPQVRIVTFAQNRGFAPAVNAGIQQAHSEYVALLNTDTVPEPGWLRTLVETMEHSPPDVGFLASKMLQLQDPSTIDDAGDTLSWYGSARKRGSGESAEAYDQLEEVFSACAGAALYRRSFLQAAGGFDERFTSYLEDIDLGLRGRLLGYRCLYVPTAQVLHQGHGSGLARSRYVYLVTRNRLALLLKSIPWTLLFKHSWTLLHGQIYFFLVYKKPLHSLAGTIAFLFALPRILRQRRALQRKKAISDRALEAMLSNRLGEMPLREIIEGKLSGL